MATTPAIQSFKRLVNGPWKPRDATKPQNGFKIESGSCLKPMMEEFAEYVPIVDVVDMLQTCVSENLDYLVSVKSRTSYRTIFNTTTGSCKDV